MHRALRARREELNGESETSCSECALSATSHSRERDTPNEASHVAVTVQPAAPRLCQRRPPVVVGRRFSSSLISPAAAPPVHLDRPPFSSPGTTRTASSRRAAGEPRPASSGSDPCVQDAQVDAQGLESRREKHGKGKDGQETLGEVGEFGARTALP